MFQKPNVPLMGADFKNDCLAVSDCGRTDHIFGEGGVEKGPKTRLELLAEMPIAMSIRKGADSGLPVVVSEPHSEFAKIYQKLARKVIQRLN